MIEKTISISSHQSVSSECVCVCVCVLVVCFDSQWLNVEEAPVTK